MPTILHLEVKNGEMHFSLSQSTLINRLLREKESDD